MNAAPALTVCTAAACARSTARPAGPARTCVEVELLAAGLLEREREPQGHETLRVTDAGIAVLAETLAKNRAARDAHEAAGRARRARDDARRPHRLARPEPARPRRRGTLRPGPWPCPMSSRSATPRSRPTWSRSCMRSRCSAPTCSPDLRHAAKRAGLPAARQRMLVRDQRRHRRARRDPARVRRAGRDRTPASTVARPAPKRPMRMRLRRLDGAGPGHAGGRLAPTKTRRAWLGDTAAAAAARATPCP